MKDCVRVNAKRCVKQITCFRPYCIARSNLPDSSQKKAASHWQLELDEFYLLGDSASNELR